LVVNTSFTFGSLYNFVLLSKKIETRTMAGRDGANSKLEVTAFGLNKGKYDKKLWVIKDDSNEGEDSYQFYKTTAYGCCGAETVQRMYSFETGQHVFSSTVEPAVVDIPNTRIGRYISYLSALAVSTNLKKAGLSKNQIGLLTLTDEHRTIDRIVIESDDRSLGSSPTLSLVNDRNKAGTTRLSLWSSDGVDKPDAVRGFSVKLLFQDGVEVIVPVNGDKFDIQAISLPVKLKAKRLSTTK